MSDYNLNTPPILKNPQPLPDSALLNSSGLGNPTDYNKQSTLPSPIPPPVLKTPNVCGEPSDKWSSKTSDAVTDEQSDGQHQPHSNLSQSAVSTPGLAIPGSYPLSSGNNTDAPYLKGAAGSAIETAKDSAGDPAKKTQGYVGAAGETISRYLPQSIAGYVAKSRSAPGLEEPAQHSATRSENLPGDSAAKLPAERHLEVLPSHDDESSTPLGRSGGVGALPGHLSEFGVAMLPDERNADRQREVLPSRDDSSVTPFGHSGDAGVLPGTFSGAAATVFPEESHGGPDLGIVNRGAPPHEEGYVGSGVQGVGLADRHDKMANYLNPLFTPSPGVPTEAPATGLPECNVPKDEGKPAESLDQLKTGHPQFLDAIKGPTDQHRQPISTGASANASIKTLYGSKQPSEKDLLETLREHTAEPPQSGAAGVVVSPVEHDQKHTHHRKHSNGDSTAANKTINTSARNHPLTGHVSPEKAPIIPEKPSQPQQIESDRPTTGHTSLSTPNADAATAYPSTTKPYTPAPGMIPSDDSGSGAAGIAAGTTRHSMGNVAGTDADARRSEDGQDQLHFSTTETAGDKLHGHPHNGKKAGFMDKLKGEAKVISGKLGGNEEKIEEGRRMMGKN